MYGTGVLDDVLEALIHFAAIKLKTNLKEEKNS